MLVPLANAEDASAPDAELVRRAVGGEPEAFGLLVGRYRPRAYSLALEVLERHEDAEDATQESLAAAFQHLAKCGKPDSFSGWLMTIVRNRSLNLLRRETIRATEAMPSQVACGSIARPDRAAEMAEIRAAISETLEGVAEVRRRVFVMHDIEGCAHAEIAATLDLKEGTVRSHLWHARAALRGALDELL